MGSSRNSGRRREEQPRLLSVQGSLETMEGLLGRCSWSPGNSTPTGLEALLVLTHALPEVPALGICGPKRSVLPHWPLQSI